MKAVENGSRYGHDLDKLSRVCELEILEVGLDPHAWIQLPKIPSIDPVESHATCTGPFPVIENTSTLARTSFANRMPLVELGY